MKAIKVALFSLIAFLTLTLFVGCDRYVTFDAGEAGSFKVLVESDLANIETPELDGYAFGGWFYDREYTEPFDPENKRSGTVFAKWSRIYKVTFDLGMFGITDDKELLVQNVAEGSTAEIPYIERRGTDTITVVGWYLDAELTDPWDEDSPITGDITVYPKFGPYYESVYFNAPTVYLQTYENLPIVSTEEYLDCSITILNADEDSSLSNASGRVRGRGNTTWTTISDKKAYRVKFDKKTDLFGMGKEKDYLLIANYMDYTLMRNDLVYLTAAKMGLEYTTETEWVHLVLNGCYEGLYLLCEHTETGTHRIDIGKDDEPGADEKRGEEIGYLIEIDGAGDYEDNRYFKFDPIRTTERSHVWRSNYTVTIKSPGGEYITDEQYDYIKEYMGRVNRAIALRDWETMNELCDMDSFIDSFIINELSFSVDMGWAFFLYKPAGEKLHYGPVWDYDQSFGNSNYGGEAYNSWRSGEENVWFSWLIECEAFRDAVRRRWGEIYGNIVLGMDSTITELYNKYIYDINANFVRWDDAIGHHCWRVPESIVALKTYDENVAFLRSWLENRIEWMNETITGW